MKRYIVSSNYCMYEDPEILRGLEVALSSLDLYAEYNGNRIQFFPKDETWFFEMYIGDLDQTLCDMYETSSDNFSFVRKIVDWLKNELQQSY